MKSILIGFILIVSVVGPAHATKAGNFILTLTITSERYSSMGPGGFYLYESACKEAGEDWLAAHKESERSNLRDAFYTCSRRGG